MYFFFIPCLVFSAFFQQGPRAFLRFPVLSWPSRLSTTKPFQDFLLPPSPNPQPTCCAHILVPPSFKRFPCKRPGLACNLGLPGFPSHVGFVFSFFYTTSFLLRNFLLSPVPLFVPILQVTIRTRTDGTLSDCPLLSLLSHFFPPTPRCGPID